MNQIKIDRIKNKKTYETINVANRAHARRQRNHTSLTSARLNSLSNSTLNSSPSSFRAGQIDQFKQHEKREIIDSFMNNDEVFLKLYDHMFSPKTNQSAFATVKTT